MTIDVFQIDSFIIYHTKPAGGYAALFSKDEF